ncbi:MAG: 50S ribosomal protein L3 [Candidatus Aenigmatarchaeota archaeon]
MPYRKRPTRGSKAFYPRKRARRIYPRIKSWPKLKEAKPLGFAGYKAGMTHAILIDTNPNSKTKGQQISKSVTILDCPPITIFGFRCYTKNLTSYDVFSENLNKNLSRKLKIPKQAKKLEEQLSKIPKNITKVTLLCHTNPTFKKKPEVFEIALGGTVEEQLKYAKENLGKEIRISNVFKQGDLVDVISVTKGKGFEGPVKRFGIKVLGRKMQQMQRHVGALGQNVPGKVRWNVPQAGQLGFQTRTEFNKRVLKIGEKGEEITPKGGFVNYGVIKNDYIVLEGSVPGPRKRLIRLRFSIRPKKTYPVDIKYISLESKQGV